uniref:Uncharacterized protein n=1 Tax=Chlamydomonas euryale TaxID=1486919 RepID=A0A7R9VEV6_9CHLO|mmetsp:Transcript_33601/g.100058  ORF Transcript_33601/g.100058 Transcript_33601/m.100058 type:complete len:128 (+) Transcript_33601:126-509(+)
MVAPNLWPRRPAAAASAAARQPPPPRDRSAPPRSAPHPPAADTPPSASPWATPRPLRPLCSMFVGPLLVRFNDTCPSAAYYFRRKMGPPGGAVCVDVDSLVQVEGPMADHIRIQGRAVSMAECTRYD